MPGTLFVVATPIGNLEDITVRALRVLREASVIAAEDTRRTGHLLARYAIETKTTSLHEHNERQKSQTLIGQLLAGDSVALVSDAGTPTISDPGQLLIQAAIAAGVRVEPIPGPNAAIAALAVSGFAVGTFTFLGFPPTRSKDRKTWMQQIGAAKPLAVFYEAPHRILRTLEELRRTIGDAQVFVGRELTKKHEQLVKGQISAVLDNIKEPKGEFTVVVEIGQTTKSNDRSADTSEEIVAEFGRMTKIGNLTRRQTIAALAERYQMSANDVYATIERAKESGE